MTEMMDVLDKRECVATMLLFEAALASAQACAALISESAARTIRSCCNVDVFDVARLLDDSGRAGSVAIPVITALKNAVGLADAAVVPFTHFASTRQAAIDTALALIAKRAMGLIQRDTLRTVASLQALAESHAADPLLARMLPQPASITSSGLKCIGRGSSSAMLHKRNPVACMVTLAASVRAPQRVAALLAATPQEHERALAPWQAELAERPGLLMAAHGAVHAMAQTLPGFQVDVPHMRATIDAVRAVLPPEAADEWFNPALARHAAGPTCRAADTRPTGLLAEPVASQPVALKGQPWMMPITPTTKAWSTAAACWATPGSTSRWSTTTTSTPSFRTSSPVSRRTRSGAGLRWAIKPAA